MHDEDDQDIKLKEMYLNAKNIEVRFRFWGKVVKHLAVVVSIYIIMNGLKPILVPGGENEIKALSYIVSAIPIGSYLGYLLFFFVSILYLKERAGKKRAIKEKSDLQKLLEHDEPNRTSSNLTKTGDTPKGD